MSSAPSPKHDPPSPREDPSLRSGLVPNVTAWHAAGRPLIGITTDVVVGEPIGGTEVRLRAVGAMTYVDAVTLAGGLAVLLPPVPALAAEHVARCDAIVMTGGADPRMEPFGQPTHPKATPMHPLRQEYEMALLAALDLVRERPVLGVCLGMQLMSIHAGGVFNQRLADTHTSHREHVGDHRHQVHLEPGIGESPLVGIGRAGGGGAVASNHTQGVTQPGRLRVLARAPDGVIEAVDNPDRPFYLGVQWHPERTPERTLGADLFARLVEHARTLQHRAPGGR